MKYRMEVTVSKTYIASETFDVEVEGDDEAEACANARDEAHDRADCSIMDADLEETDVSINSVIPLQDENGDPITPRCDKTPDMFQDGK